MKLIKINIDHYVVVDDSEIKEGDWLLDITDNTIWDCHKDMPNSLFPECKKITHSTEPLDKSLFFTDRVWGCERLSLGEVKELIGEVDRAKEYTEKEYYKIDDVEDFNGELTTKTFFKFKTPLAVYRAYNQALEDNKEKKYTEADLLHAFREGVLLPNSQIGIMEDIFKQVVQSLQPKTEWEIELVNGKLKLL